MTLFHHIARLSALAGLLSMAACHSLPTYQPAPNEAVTTAKFIGMGQPYMCRGGIRYKLDVLMRDGFRTALLPTEQRISVWSAMSYVGYNIVSTCAPSIGFVPRAGTGVIVNSGLASGQCFIEVVRDDPSQATGVATEPTAGAPAC